MREVTRSILEENALGPRFGGSSAKSELRSHQEKFDEEVANGTTTPRKSTVLSETSERLNEYEAVGELLRFARCTPLFHSHAMTLVEECLVKLLGRSGA